MNQVDDEFEQILRTALHSKAPGADFTDGVMQRLALSPVRSRGTLLHMPRRWIAGALAASLLAGSAGIWAEWKHRQRQQEAERQFALAMQVTSHALQHTREQLSRAGFRLVDEQDDNPK